jgi:KDO2-lipid IV(A) lauroyltransferase
VKGLADLAGRLAALRLAPDGRPRPDAPFGRGPLAGRALGRVIDGASWAGCRLPAGLAHALARVGGTAEWAARPALRRALAENLAHAVGQPAGSRAVRRLVRRELVNEARRSADLLWALGRPEEFLRTVVIEDAARVSDTAARGRGLILVGIHIGGWEVATGVPAALVNAPVTVIVADDWLAWGIDRMRTAAGLRAVYRTEPALRAARLLRDGGVLLALGDDGQGAALRGYEVRFLDGRAVLPGGLMALARLSGSPLVGFHVLPDGPRRWRILIDPPLEAPPAREGEEGERRVLQQLADRWSAVIRAHPDHWAARYPIHWTGDAGAS